MSLCNTVENRTCLRYEYVDGAFVPHIKQETTSNRSASRHLGQRLKQLEDSHKRNVAVDVGEISTATPKIATQDASNRSAMVNVGEETAGRVHGRGAAGMASNKELCRRGWSRGRRKRRRTRRLRFVTSTSDARNVSSVNARCDCEVDNLAVDRGRSAAEGLSADKRGVVGTDCQSSRSEPTARCPR